MIVFLPLVEVNYPNNALGLNSSIMFVANGLVVPSKTFATTLEKMFSFGPQAPFNLAFDNIGKSSHAMILNTGSPFFIFYGSLIFLPLIFTVFY